MKTQFNTAKAKKKKKERKKEKALHVSSRHFVLSVKLIYLNGLPELSESSFSWFNIRYAYRLFILVHTLVPRKGFDSYIRSSGCSLLKHVYMEGGVRGRLYTYQNCLPLGSYLKGLPK